MTHEWGVFLRKESLSDVVARRAFQVLFGCGDIHCQRERQENALTRKPNVIIVDATNLSGVSARITISTQLNVTTDIGGKDAATGSESTS